MKWSARGVAAMRFDGPLQLLVRRLAQHEFAPKSRVRWNPPLLMDGPAQSSERDTTKHDAQQEQPEAAETIDWDIDEWVVMSVTALPRDVVEAATRIQARVGSKPSP
jgi:hypothetical protein